MDGRYLMLMPSEAADLAGAAEAKRRQQVMETWYDDLARDPAAAARTLERDYRPFAALLGGLRGTILDLGGGVGFPRHYLPPDADYIVLDPSVAWLSAKWTVLKNDFPCLGTQPPFIQGVGEYVPLEAGSVDAVLAFWSLNHVTEPGKVVAEILRLLRPGGRCILVLEDMVPTVRDVVRQVAVDLLRGRFLNALSGTRGLRPSVRRSWPLQEDHVRVTEQEIAAWTAPHVQRARRTWIGGFLTLDLEKGL